MTVEYKPWLAELIRAIRQEAGQQTTPPPHRRQPTFAALFPTCTRLRRGIWKLRGFGYIGRRSLQRRLRNALRAGLTSAQPIASPEATPHAQPDSDAPIILICSVTIRSQDGVGNDVLLMLDALRQQRQRVAIFADTSPNELAELTVDLATAIKYARRPSTRLVYHHSIDWERGAALVQRSTCPFYLRYHNVTPPEFFAPYHPKMAAACALGRAQTADLIRLRPDLVAVPDSHFNLYDLHALGFTGMHMVVAPLARYHELGRAAPDAPHPRWMDPAHDNLLFVGRMAPNKGHADLIRVLAAYAARYGRGVRLNLVGWVEPELHRYYAHLYVLARDLGVADLLTIVHMVPITELAAAFRHAGCFVCTSQHEGFCLPIVEAQAVGLPVVVLDRGAVGETAGTDQLVFQTMDPDLFAIAAHCAMHDHAVRSQLIAHGKNNLERFTTERLCARLVDGLAIG